MARHMEWPGAGKRRRRTGFPAARSLYSSLGFRMVRTVLVPGYWRSRSRASYRLNHRSIGVPEFRGYAGNMFPAVLLLVQQTPEPVSYLPIGLSLLGLGLLLKRWAG